MNPWIIVAALVVWAASLTAAWNYGDTTGFNRAEAERAGQQDKEIKALNKQLADAQAQAGKDKVAQAEAVAAADAAKGKLNKALRELRNEKTKPAASCVTAAWRMRVNAAVAAANSSGAASAGSMPDGVPASSGAGRGSGSVGGGDAGGSR